MLRHVEELEVVGVWFGGAREGFASWKCQVEVEVKTEVLKIKAGKSGMGSKSS